MDGAKIHGFSRFINRILGRGEAVIAKTKIHGFSRVQIEENGKIVGDSGWNGPNMITNIGFRDFLVDHILGSAEKSIGFVALGTGGAIASDATSLAGEIMGGTKRVAPTTSIIASRTAQFAATFASSASFLTGASNLSNIGLFASSEVGTIFAGNTFASSSCNTNQNVNVTYQIRFSTS